ncbi:hypothetical protein QP794_07395 [Paenibacillus sp. UMB7766-LJ446]|uniref:glycoside hydrolase family 2 protein n=1 Tax=Paenibacillus sp. UMB7766-LJ446 TaxID=3046313 RepID=UPI00254A9205|nr:glycoside hydrolase family 2 protein [Paenibacillus sp. UMB7766-LJ446]MDK8189907.1 hypothetical protein [Paenibacillus sp. UMB7766-LJ446]
MKRTDEEDWINGIVPGSVLSSKEVIALDFGTVLDTRQKRRQSYLEFDFIVDGSSVSSGTVLFVKPKHFDFQNPKISTAVTETDDLFVVEVQSEAFAKFVKLDLSNADSLWSDNIFDLSASRPKSVTVQKNSLIKALSLVEFREQLMVHSLFDTYALYG